MSDKQPKNQFVPANTKDHHTRSGRIFNTLQGVGQRAAANVVRALSPRREVEAPPSVPPPVSPPSVLPPPVLPPPVSPPKQQQHSITPLLDLNTPAPKRKPTKLPDPPTCLDEKYFASLEDKTSSNSSLPTSPVPREYDTGIASANDTLLRFISIDNLTFDSGKHHVCYHPQTILHSTIHPPTMANPPTRSKLADFKPPAWMPTDAEAWFKVLELMFKREDITSDEDKCVILLGCVPAETTAKISTIAWKSAYAIGDYEIFKQALIALNAETVDEKINRLLDDEVIGDQKPSELYSKMEKLAESISGTVPARLIFNRWSRKLPTQLAAYALTVSQSFDKTVHLKVIDELHAFYKTKPQISAVSVDNYDDSRGYRGRSRSRRRSSSPDHSPSRGRSKSRGRSPSAGRRPRNKKKGNPNYCWYHRKFGAKARKCAKNGCTFKLKSSSENEEQ